MGPPDPGLGPIFVDPAPGVRGEGVAGPAPSGVGILRVLGVVQALHVVFALAYAGLVGAAALDGHAPAPPWLAPLLVAGLGIVGVLLLGLCGVCVAVPRRPWMYPTGIVLAVVSAGCGCWPLAIAVLVLWLRPEVREWCRGGTAG